MNDFDLVVTGNIVPDADAVITDGFVAIREGKVALVGAARRPWPPSASMRGAGGSSRA